MNRALQSLALGVYRLINASGVLATPLGRKVFEASYSFYKSRFEAWYLHDLCRLIEPGTTVVDVGANIGIFTLPFAKAVGSSGHVIAIEPERQNFERLQAQMRSAGLDARVQAIQRVAADHEAEFHLQLNPDHPGDHRIAENGIPVRAVTLDGVLAAHGWPEVSLIKIDVQGAEAMVIAGATETLRRLQPTLFIEIDDANLQTMGSGAEQLVTQLVSLGYSIAQFGRGNEIARLSSEEALAILTVPGSYADFLFQFRDSES